MADRSALILSGGYAFGAYQVGVLRALASGKCPHRSGAPFAPEIFTGTSIGAVNCALLLSAPPGDFPSAVDHLRNLYLDELATGSGTCGKGLVRLRGNPGPLFDPACYSAGVLAPATRLMGDLSFFAQRAAEEGSRFLRSPVGIQQHFVELMDLSLLFSPDPFHRFIRRNVSPERIRQSGRALQILAANWCTGALRIFEADQLTGDTVHEALLASAALPALVPPVPVNGELYVDGGAVMNTGLRPAILAGAGDLHVVYLDDVTPLRAGAEPRGTAEIIFRALAIALASMLNRDIEIATRLNEQLRAARFTGEPARTSPSGRPYREIAIHRYRAPASSSGVMGWISFDRDHLISLMEAGFRDTMQHDCERSECCVETKAAAAS